ncbi:unnamed protein product, partial [Mesorhabditis belari]|uniref:C-type lectin domain-containing protein n=1 Tax=Mesorhabditis belari TaxID=2138241 RepID=A0AAF3J472_9BILA
MKKLFIQISFLLLFFHLLLCDPDCLDGYFYKEELDLCLQYPIFNGNRYQIDWKTASLFCQKSGGNLPSIHNAFTNGIWADLQKISGHTSEFWLGAEHESNETWRWIDETPFDYQHFQRSTAVGDCVTLDASDQLWKLRDCLGWRFFFCTSQPLLSTDSTSFPTTIFPTHF